MRSKTARLISWTTGGFLWVLAAFRAPAEVTYFLLSTRLVGSALGSCVLPLTKPEDIAEARREMTLDQPPLIPLVRITAGADGINRDLHWVDLGANYLYTVETSSSFSPANWMPAPGGSWPIAGTNWVDIATPLSGPRFYRVKAELKSP